MHQYNNVDITSLLFFSMYASFLTIYQKFTLDPTNTKTYMKYMFWNHMHHARNTKNVYLMSLEMFTFGK
jgi:hypothetical protein